MNRTARRFVLGAGALLAVAGAAGLLRAARAPVVTVVRAARQPLAQTLVISGRVMPPSRVNVGAMVAGTVSRRFVEDGSRVRAGQELLRLDDAEAVAARAQARAAASQAAARLDQLRAVGLPLAAEALAQARVNAQRTEREHERVRALAEKGIVTAAQLDDARQAMELARIQVRVATVQQEGTSPSGVEERAARAALEQAVATEAAAETRLGYMLIRAPQDGVIISRRVEAGDTVQPGQTLLVLAVDGPTLLTIDPDEKNLSAIEIGQAATASADAFPRQTFAAAVSFIGAAVDPQRGTVEVRLTVPAPPPTLRPDMTVSVELQAGRRNEALTIPGECVRDVTGRDPWVLVLNAGRVERRTVRTGLRGDTLVEIVSGLAEGDLVIPASAGSPEPGERLEPRLAGR